MPVIGNIARLMTRHLYSLIHGSDSWDKVFSIPHNHPAIEEIFFWKETLLNINVRYLSNSVLPETIVYSDASDSAAGPIPYHSMIQFFMLFGLKKTHRKVPRLEKSRQFLAQSRLMKQCLKTRLSCGLQILRTVLK